MKALLFALFALALPVAQAGTVIYTYDAAGRLSAAQFQHTGGSFSYVMDAAGNVAEQHSTPVPEAPVPCGVAMYILWRWRRRTANRENWMAVMPAA